MNRSDQRLDRSIWGDVIATLLSLYLGAVIGTIVDEDRAGFYAVGGVLIWPLIQFARRRVARKDIDVARKDDVALIIYAVGGVLTGGITFVGCWIYAIATFGWFLGLGLGWIPSLFIAYLVGFLWPLIAVVIGVALALAYSGRF